jgi:16S rRNA (adenine1518-N6/adenine1519-N6)-dimethyltransferase
VALAGAGARVLAIEYDKGLVAALREVTAALPGVEVLHADAMKADWTELLGEDPWRMVSNLPYNIATPLLLDLLSAGLPIGGYLVMVQREVGERLAARPGDDQYGAVSVRVAWRAGAEIVRRVPAEVFWPRPRVESVLVRLTPLGQPPSEVDPAVLFRLIEEGFAQRRKTMANALRRLGMSADGAASALRECGIGERARAEELSLEDFVELAESGVVPDA